MAFGWGRPADYDDPFVGFSAIHPLFVLDESGARYEIPKSRLKFFAPESCPAKKGPNTFRVFCLGGSTVQGRPYSKETSFTTWLRLSLEAADSSRDWQVVNCGGISYASYRLVPILEECLGYEPDLIILCTGHNEFLEERTYGDVKNAPPVVAVPHRMLARLHTYVALREGVRWITGERATTVPANRVVLKDEADALLDYRRGIRAYHRDEAWRAGVIDHFRRNVRGMIGTAENAGVPVFVVLPPSNLCDSPPFKSEHRRDLSDEELDEWRSLIGQARGHYRDDLPASIRLLKKALALDRAYAATHYELAKAYEALGLQAQAREAFLEAREQDVCPLRILRPMEVALADAAREAGVPLLDAHALLEGECPSGILGNYYLVDHVHPSIPGHQRIAEGLTREMVAQGWVRPVTDWEAKRAAAYDRHEGSLDDFYFLKAERTLRSVRAWTQGRADGPPIESRWQPARDEVESKD